MAEVIQSRERGRIPQNAMDETRGRVLERFSSVLLVDDSKFLADTLAIFFQLDGFSARAVYGGRQALDAMAEEMPDIAFIDLGMPGIDGLEVARQARASLSGKVPLLVALTGWEDEDHRKDALDAGFSHFLVKPVDPAAIRAFLSKLISD